MPHVIGDHFPILSPIRGSSEIHQYPCCVSKNFYKILIRSPTFGLLCILSTHKERTLVHLRLSVNILTAGLCCKPTGVTRCKDKTLEHQPLFPRLHFRTQRDKESLYGSRKERIFCNANWNEVQCLPSVWHFWC